MDFIGGGRDGRQQTELKVHFSLSAATVLCTLCADQCVVLQCVLAGLMYAGGRWCFLAMDQLYLPGWCPPQTPPIVCRLCTTLPRTQLCAALCTVPPPGCNWVWGN